MSMERAHVPVGSKGGWCVMGTGKFRVGRGQCAASKQMGGGVFVVWDGQCVISAELVV